MIIRCFRLLRNTGFLATISLVAGPLGAQLVVPEDHSAFPTIAKLNYQTYGDPVLSGLNLELANARSAKPVVRSPAAQYAAELLELSQLTDLAARHLELESFEATRDLLQLVTQGQTLGEAGVGLAAEFQAQRLSLVSNKRDPIFLERHEKATKAHLTSHATLEALLARLSTAFEQNDPNAKRDHLDLLIDWFATNPVAPRLRLSAFDEPKNPPARLPISRSIDRAELDISANGIPISKKKRREKDLDPPSGEPAPADLAETLETERTPEILALAASLENSSVKIFNWVHQNIHFDAYVGSRRGATETLRLGAGNDMDQASLLIALLRAANIPCRYARGTIELTPEAANNWLGTQSASSAGALLSTAAMDGMTINNGPEVHAIRCTRVWVEAYVPFGDYRGAGAASGENLWVPLDPAFKRYDNEFGIDLPTTASFGVDQFLTNYYSSNTSATIVEEFESILAPDLPAPETIEGNSLQRELATPELPWLPASLPNSLISLDARFPEIADVDRYKIRFLISGEGANLDKTVLLPEIAGKQLTLSYRGATAADQTLITNNGGLDGIAQPWMVKVLPELKIDGCVVATGTGSVSVGMMQSSQFFFIEPGAGAMTESFTNTIVAGSYQGLAIGTGRIQVDAENRELECPEDNTGEFQHKLGMRYLELNDLADRRIAGTFQAVLWKGVSNAILGQQISVAYSGSTPLTFNYTGLYVDADRAGATPFSATGNDIFYRFGRVRGAQSSQNEHLVFERYLGDDSVSTIRILRVAAERGIPIFDIDSFNAASLIPQLTHPASTINDIIAEINQGKRVTVPRDPLTYFEWSGTGYIQLETTNGTGGYIISGRLSGGANAKKKKKPDCDQVITILVEPPQPPGGYTNCDLGVVTISAAIKTYNQKECDPVGFRVDEKKFSPSTLAPGFYPFKFGSAGACGCGVKTVTIQIKENEVHYNDTQGRPSIGGILEIAENGSEDVTATSGKADTRWQAGGGATPPTATGAIVPFTVDIPASAAGLPKALLPIPAVTWMIFPSDPAFIRPRNLVPSCGIETNVRPFPNNTFEFAFDFTEQVKERVAPNSVETTPSQALGALHELLEAAITLTEMVEAIDEIKELLGDPYGFPKPFVSGKIFIKDQIKEVGGSNRVEWTGTLGIGGEIGVSGDIPIGSAIALGVPPPLADARIIVPVKGAFAAELSGDMTYRRPASWPSVNLPKAEFSVGFTVGIGVQASIAGGFATLRATGSTGASAKLPITPLVTGRNLKLQSAIEFEVGGLTMQYQVSSFFGVLSSADTWQAMAPHKYPQGGATPKTFMDITPD